MKPQLPLRVVIVRKTMEAADIALFELADPSGAELPPFDAGSHIDVEAAPGIIRQYSLCNNSTERDRYLVAVLKEPAGRGGSAAMHELSEGCEIRVSQPRNHFALEGSARRSILFAGGIGVTPILCMAERLAAVGADFEMHYATRSRSRCAFYDRILTSSFADRVHFYFDDGEASQQLDVDAAVARAGEGSHVYVCGPGGYIDLVRAAAVAQGLPDSQFHREYFTVGAPSAPDGDDAFQVKLASSGQVLDVKPDQTIVEVLRENGVDLPTSCEQGICGTCLTRVLEGVPDHRDYYLTDEERAANEEFLPCCSRSKSAMLVIDI